MENYPFYPFLSGAQLQSDLSCVVVSATVSVGPEIKRLDVLLESFYSISAGNDVLICGTCKSMYSSLATFVQHKKQKCELKTLCKCQNQPIVENNLSGKCYFHFAALSYS